MFNLIKKRASYLEEDKKKPFPPAKGMDEGEEGMETAPTDATPPGDLSHDGLAAHYQSLADHHKAQAEGGAPAPTPGDLSEYGAADPEILEAGEPDPLDTGGLDLEDEYSESPKDEAAEPPAFEKGEKAKGLEVDTEDDSKEPAMSAFAKFRKGKK